MPDSTVVLLPPSPVATDTLVAPVGIDSAASFDVAAVLPDTLVADTLSVAAVEPPAFCLDSLLAGGVTEMPMGKPEMAWTDPLPFAWETVSPFRPEGVAGDPLPYRFRNDDIVTSALMVGFFLMVWTIARGWLFLAGSMKNFFRERVRDNLFTERPDTEMQGQFFLIFQTCFLLGILFFDYTQGHMADVFNNVSPYLVLGAGAGICYLYYLVKLLLYSFVNNVFFDRRRASSWTDAYLLSIFVLGMALLPLTLLVVYFDLSFAKLQIMFVLILGVVKMLLFYKCFRIFFNYGAGVLHLILYFCALEILPLLALWRALVFVNINLVVI